MGYVTPDSVILVTGASGAIGFEIAAQAAECGATVAAHASKLASVDDAVTRLKARVPGAKLIPAPADFHQPGAAVELIERVAREAGRLDAIVHCAVIGAPNISGPFKTTDPASFALLVQNSIAMFQEMCFVAIPIIGRQGGAILTFASDSGRFAAPRQSLLAGAYGGLMSFVRNVALEAARDGVRVHCISPSFVAETPIYDTYIAMGGRAEAARKRAGLGLPTPKDIAPIALFLCGPDSARITGQIISINGGMNA